MIGEVCRAYGWKLDDVLNMPIPRFFAMRKAALALDATEKMDLCDIQAIALGDSEYFRTVRTQFLDRMDAALARPENQSKKQPTLNDSCLKGEEARDAVMSLFSAQRRSMGHG